METAGSKRKPAQCSLKALHWTQFKSYCLTVMMFGSQTLKGGIWIQGLHLLFPQFTFPHGLFVFFKSQMFTVKSTYLKGFTMGSSEYTKIRVIPDSLSAVSPQLPHLSAGIPIKSTVDNSTTMQYAGLMHSFIMKARSTVREIDPQNDLTFLRIRSKKNEIMVAPGKRALNIQWCQASESPVVTELTILPHQASCGTGSVKAC